jgi:hypothetical protein
MPQYYDEDGYLVLFWPGEEIHLGRQVADGAREIADLAHDVRKLASKIANLSVSDTPLAVSDHVDFDSRVSDI